MKIDRHFGIVVAILYELLLSLYLIIVSFFKAGDQLVFDGTMAFTIFFLLLWICAFIVHYRSSSIKDVFSKSSENDDILDADLVESQKITFKRTPVFLRFGNLLFGFLNLLGGVIILFAFVGDFDQSDIDLNGMTIFMLFTLAIFLFLGAYITIDSAIRYIKHTND